MTLPYPPITSNEKVRNWKQLRLSTLLLLIAILALSIGWWTDHKRLTLQLEARTVDIAMFTLVNSDVTKLVEEMEDMFPVSLSNPTSIVAVSQTNSLVVTANKGTLKEIEAHLLEIDPGAKRQGFPQ